jgi:A/G-specific adenine glycosylase
MVVERHGGVLPDSIAGLMALPGIGRYTAGAIGSIAFNRPAALVDGNVARVLSRLFAVAESPRGPAGQQRLWHLAEAALPPKRPGAFNEALMELGALICRPRAPQCRLCPLQSGCRARLSGDPVRFPVRAARKARPVRRGVLLLARRGDRLLVRRRPPGGLWGGLWEFPWTERQAEESPRDAVRRLAREMSLPSRPAAQACGAVSHGLTHFQLELDCFVLVAATPSARSPDADVRWVTRDEWEALALGRLHHKALELLQDG